MQGRRGTEEFVMLDTGIRIWLSSLSLVGLDIALAEVEDNLTYFYLKKIPAESPAPVRSRLSADEADRFTLLCDGRLKRLLHFNLDPALVSQLISEDLVPWMLHLAEDGAVRQAKKQLALWENSLQLRSSGIPLQLHCDVI